MAKFRTSSYGNTYYQVRQEDDGTKIVYTEPNSGNPRIDFNDLEGIVKNEFPKDNVRITVKGICYKEGGGSHHFEIKKKC